MHGHRPASLPVSIFAAPGARGPGVDHLMRMRILVTGAGGMLGRDVVRAAEFVNHEVIALEHSDLDVTDVPAVWRAIRRRAPDVVINCAAWTDVDGAEADPRGAERLNALAAGEVAAAAAEGGASGVPLSTHYVFDRGEGAPYIGADPPRPPPVHGRPHRPGEHEG